MDTTRQMERLQAIRAQQQKNTGGVVVKPNSRQGRIVFVNRQSRMKQKAIEDIAAQLSQLSRLDIASVKGEADIPPAKAAERYGATIALTITDEKGAPLMLLAPEDGWGVLNVSRIKPGENFDAACCKGLLRTFAHLCMSGMSQIGGNVMSAVRLEDALGLDSSLPMDVTMKQLKYLSAMGVTPDVRTTYVKACREGWAPAPTNDVQRAIWERTRAEKERGPTKPITIQPPKR